MKATSVAIAGCCTSVVSSIVSHITYENIAFVIATFSGLIGIVAALYVIKSHRANIRKTQLEIKLLEQKIGQRNGGGNRNIQHDND